MLEESSPDVRLAADPLEAGADLTAQATQIVRWQYRLMHRV
jgi:hypothetical protein